MIYRKTIWMATLAASLMICGGVQSASPHFIGGVVNHGIQGTSDLVTGKIAGLGNEDVLVTATADAAALFACRNKGGNFPSDPKKQSEVQQLSNTVRITPENGQVTFAILLGPVTTILACPGSQVVVLACVEFANKTASFEQTLSGATGSEAAVPSTASAIYFSQFAAECNALFANN